MNSNLPQLSFSRTNRKRTKTPVTIAIGFACKGSLMLVSDSQMSAGGKFKRHDEPKVFPVRFADDNCAIIAISGVLDSAARFREIFEEKALQLTPTTARSIADTLEIAMKETRAKFVSYVSEDKLSGEKLSEYINNFDFEVILGYYHDKIPYLYHSSLYHGNAIPCRGKFEAIGCGTDVASFILTGADLFNSDDGEALGLAYYAVETCKKYDQACGGPFQHISLNQENSRPGAYDPLLLAVYQRVFENSESIIHDAIVGTVRTTFKEMWKDGETEPDPQ